MLRGESSSNSWRWTYHVFLSFRGEDTRLDFTDHLYAALVRKGIIAFRDDKQLEKGDAIAEELPKAIEESLGAIVILSENYASSSWCLDELNKILESNRVLGREVFPVFYGVSPGEVQHQKTQSFYEAFKKHERRSGKDTEKVQKWRDSLKELGQIPGWESKHYQHQTELIENIVESVWTKLRPKMPSFNDGLIGIGSRVKKMDSLLSIESEDVRFIGIWGMGGIGKTTVARVVFQKIKDQFDVSCFLDNVREISRETNGMLRLQTKLLSHLAIKGLEIIDLDEGKNTIINLLSEKKVLLVLDDVDDTSQLGNLAKRVEWFGRGSRVIITTRDTQVLISHGVVENYNIEFLNSDESLQLLSQKAFKRDEPLEHYLELSKVVAKHAGGLPLALELLGSFLCGRSEFQWREVVDMIKEVSASHIVMKSLRISYNGLPRCHKALFLDIACFFKGRVKELATQTLEICDRYPAVGIELLVEKSLATYDGFTIGMHDLLQETAREIVIEESHVDAGKRSRLWSLEDTNQVLKYSRENESIEGIALNSPEKDEANWDPEAFSRMYNLRLLIISFPIKLARGLKCLCSSLKFLQWNDFSLETLPLGVQLDELVELKMYSSKIKNIWNGNQAFAKLKFIDLSYSEDLIQTPIVSGAPCLERMLLIGCINLVEVHPSVGQHKRLVVLCMKNCKNLQIMPRKLEMDSLEELILSGCSKVKKLPEFGKNMKSLSLLSVENCINLLCLPNSICNLKSLRKLNISGCSRLSTLPNGLNENESLEELDVSGTAIREITLSKVRLEKLKELSFGGRKELAPNSQNLLLWISKFMRQPNLKESTMPPLSSLLALVSLDLSYCDLNDESFPSHLGSLSLLQDLDLSGNNFVNPPAQCIINLSMLQNLSFNDCPRLESLPVLPPNLQGLYANNCPKLKPFNLDEEMLWKIYETQSRMDPVCLLYTPSSFPLSPMFLSYFY
ncbi:hypothetical protein AAZV13_02G229300 [Glycine max]